MCQDQGRGKIRMIEGKKKSQKRGITRAEGKRLAAGIDQSERVFITRSNRNLESFISFRLRHISITAKYIAFMSWMNSPPCASFRCSRPNRDRSVRGNNSKDPCSPNARRCLDTQTIRKMWKTAPSVIGICGKTR
jgi:hypothetical protein